MLGRSCSCLFLNPILEAEQASIYPLGGDLGLMRLTLDSAALDWSQTTCRISTVWLLRSTEDKNWRIEFYVYKYIVEEQFCVFHLKLSVPRLKQTFSLLTNKTFPPAVYFCNVNRWLRLTVSFTSPLYLRSKCRGEMPPHIITISSSLTKASTGERVSC